MAQLTSSMIVSGTDGLGVIFVNTVPDITLAKTLKISVNVD